MNYFLFGCLTAIALFTGMIFSVNQDLKKEVQVQQEIIKACEADRIRLLND